ncbi:jg5019 [Pararge aegeria aegeria]|uniref:Jg5019 protein n=1 Tax=Pararge aegeria aegeria TaxID=348720 RepID=A0A8S4QG92_9NEOP|nr:jg5019 [Pararge aegeria aegeria]
MISPKVHQHSDKRRTEPRSESSQEAPSGRRLQPSPRCRRALGLFSWQYQKGKAEASNTMMQSEMVTG